MNKKQIDDILSVLSLNYKNLDIEEISDAWSTELSQYNYDDVKKRLDELMTKEEYHLKAPFLVTILKGLTKVADKVNFNKLTYYCQFCGRAFNDMNAMIEHEERCRSVRYILKQYKRFSLGQIDKRILYNLPQEEFDEKYKKLLRIVQQRTNNEQEKQIIENIFNPPSQEQAKKIINERG